MKHHAPLATMLVVAACATAGCTTNTGVKTSADFLAAERVEALAPTALGPAKTHAWKLPPEQPRVTGAQAVSNAARNVLVLPTDRDVDGNTWVIRDIDQRKIYGVPVQPGSSDDHPPADWRNAVRSGGRGD